MIILFCILMIFWALNDWAEAADWEASETLAEIRHQELLDAQERSLSRQRRRVRRRRLIKDKNGNIIAEEIIVDDE